MMILVFGLLAVVAVIIIVMLSKDFQKSLDNENKAETELIHSLIKNDPDKAASLIKETVEDEDDLDEEELMFVLKHDES